MQQPITYAAIDLGSNSFHMIIAREVDGQLQLLDRHKETIRLRMGLDAQGNLDDSAQERALACLTRFGQRLRGIEAHNIRAVGTNTLRLASNASGFLQRAELALGAQIDIIAGHEEARLIYLGVSHFLPSDDSQRLVIDIGGGSTEFIIGTHFNPSSMTSTEMGCVAVSQGFDLTTNITKESFHHAVSACQLVLRPHVPKLRALGWDRAIGASGSIKAICDTLNQNGWSTDGVTLEGMYQLRDALIAGKKLDTIKLAGLSDDRKPVMGGGLAVLIAAFELLDISRMHVSQGALREGLILDMLGRIHHTQDAREASILSLIASSRIDSAQANRVADCAAHFFAQTQESWQLTHPTLPLEQLLRWAALAHEVGYFISSRKYRQHSAYILENADLAGFNQEEQKLVAWLALYHRSKLSVKEMITLPEEMSDVMFKLLVILRLAARLHRGRESTLVPPNLSVNGNQLTLQFSADWLTQNPLTQLDLEIEAKRLEGAGFTLTLSE
jgi:exopolyphosphatase/guanosine-5'-triphosphate,3'-diphosphate pyrophosphatase